MHRSLPVAVYASVLQARRTFYLAVLPYLHVLYIACIHYRHVRSYGTCFGCDRRHIFPDDALESGHKSRTVPVKGHDIGLMRRKTVVYHDFPASGLVQHGHFHPVSEAAAPVGKYYVHVLYEAVMAYLVVRYIVFHVLDAAVILHGDIVQGGVVQAGMFPYSSGHLEHFPEPPQTDLPRKSRIIHIFRSKVFGYFHVIPV